MSARVRSIREIRKLIDLAFLYADDGALHTAADRLQSAADLMRAQAQHKDQRIADLGHAVALAPAPQTQTATRR